MESVPEPVAAFLSDDALRVLDALCEPVLVHASDTGAIVTANSAACDLFRYSREEMAKLTPRDLTGNRIDNAQTKARKLIRAALEEGPQLFQWESKTRTGREFPTEISLKRAVIGGMDCVLVLVRDVSEREERTSEIADGREYLETLVNTSHDGILVVDADGRFEFGNNAFFNTFSWPPEDLIGHHFIKVVPTDQHAFILERWKEVQAGKGAPYEVDIVTKAGERRSLMVSHKDMTIGGKRKYCVVVKDVTDRKKNELALANYRDHLEELVEARTLEVRQSEERYRKLVELSPDAIGLIHKSQIQLVNAAALELFGAASEEDLIGHSPWEFVSAEFKAESQERLRRLLAAGGSFPPREVALMRLDGQRVFAEYVSAFVPYGDDPAVLVIARDVTGRKTMEDALRDSHDRLRSLADRLETVREEERRRIAHQIHDDLGHELTALKLELSALARSLKKHTRARRRTEWDLALTRMKSNTDLLIQSVRQLASDLRPPVLDLGLQAAIEWQAENFQERSGITCNVTARAHDLALDIRRSTAVFRVFQEVLTNVARHAEATRVDVSLQETEGELTVEIRDNGIGIDLDRDASGSAMGIIGMEEKAHMLGGHLTIGPSPEKGTRIVLRIPIRIPQSANALV